MVSTLCKALTVVAIVFAVAFVIVGGILPTVLNNVINSSVKSTLVLSASDQAANNDKYTKWAKNTDVNIDYYFFSITNLDDALSTGNKLIVKEMGPYSYQKVIVRFNVTFPDATQVRYFEYIYYVPQFQAGKDPTVDMITTVNLPWLLAVGSTAVAPTSLLSPIFDSGDNDQVTTLMYGMYVNALSQIAPIFLNATSSPFLSVVRLNMIPNVINYLNLTFDPNQFFNHFSTSPRACTADINCTSVYTQTKCLNSVCAHVLGMGVDIHGSFSPAASAFLFTPGPFSFTNFSLWGTYLQVFSANQSKIADTSAWPPGLASVFTVADMGNFVTWVAQLVSPLNTNFQSVCSNVMQAKNPTVASAFNNFATWSDYGIFQFTTGGIVLQLTGDPSKRSIADVPNSPLPVGPEPFKMQVPIINMTYSTAQRLLNYTLVGIGLDSIEQILTQFDRQYMFYIVNNFVFPLIINPLAKGGLFTTRTASELLWGYYDPLAGPFPGWAGNYSSQDEAWLDTMDQPNIKYTGSDDVSKAGSWKTVSGQSTLTNMTLFPDRSPPCVPGGTATIFTPQKRFGYAVDCALWSSPEVLDGSSDGTSTAPFKEGNPATNFAVYVSEAVRVVPFTYRGDVTYKGITLNNYTINQNAMLSSASYPPNTKYWMNDSDLIIPIIRYWGGVDLFLSNPHFLTASPDLFASLTAGFNATYLAPDYSKHQSYVLTEPLSGITMSVHKRLMSGVKLSAARLAPIENPSTYTLYAYDKYAKLWNNGIATKMYLPTFWVDEYGQISDSDASSFKNSVYQTRNVAKGIQIAFVIFGGLGLVVIAIFFYRQSKSTTTG